jgi:hypothetical protein
MKQVVVITGASSGFGALAARRLFIFFLPTSGDRQRSQWPAM